MKRLLVCAVLLLIPWVQAASEHEAAILSASLDMQAPLNLTAAQEIHPDGGAVTSGGCGGGSLRIEPTERWFFFQETRDEGGCAEVRVAVSLPHAVDDLTLSFIADRRIEQASRDERLQLPVDVIQEVRIYNQTGTELDRVPYYERTAEADATPRPFAIDLGGTVTEAAFQVGWYFEDVQDTTSSASSPLTGRSFLSTITSPVLQVHQMPLPFADINTTGSTEDGDNRIDTVQAILPIHGGWTGEPEATVQILVVDLVEFQSLETPGGRHPASSVSSATQGGRTTLTLSDDLLGDGGEVRLFFIGRTPLPPPPPPAEPTRLPALVWLALALPGLAMAAATTHQVGLHKALQGQQRATMMRKDIELVVLSSIYLGVAAFVAIDAMGWMSVVPPSRRATFVYLVLAAVLFGFLVHWGIGAIRRRHARALRHAQELERTNQELARSNRDLEQFAYVASHDLQEPLRKVQSFTALLDKRYAGQLDERAGNYIHNANDAAGRARALIRDLLAYARIGDAERIDVELEKVVREAISDMSDLIAEHDAQIKVDALPHVPGAPALLRQLFGNLISNGIKYAHPERRPQIHIAARQRGKEVVVAVQDNGIGIPKEYRDKVFQLFTRLHGSDSSLAGSGIGLAICQRIVEGHGGRIWLESGPDLGTVFYVALPIE